MEVSISVSSTQALNHGEDLVRDALQLGVDLGEWAGWLENVEVPVERDLVAHLGLFVIDPSIRGMGQYLALEVVLHLLVERDVLGIAQGGVGNGLALVLSLGGEDDVPGLIPLGALDGDGAVAEVLVPEDPADGHAVLGDFLKASEDPGDLVDVLILKFLALAPEAFPHFLPVAAGVDELDFALSVLGLAVADDPDVGADARVVEHVGGQGDDGLDEVILQQVPADLALP